MTFAERSERLRRAALGDARAEGLRRERDLAGVEGAIEQVEIDAHEVEADTAREALA